EVIEGEAANYWNTPMDVTDEAAIWAMLSAPITVIDSSYKGQTKVYAEPSDDSRAVAVVTGKSQGVRVIEHRTDGWSLIELYSATFHDNSIDAWNMLVQGYVKTEKLLTKEVTDKYGIVVDKLTQRAYLFSEEGLVSTLLISTGLANPEQPYNETRSGEFLYISATGGFQSDNMYCPMAMKFNDGDLLHEVPYVQRSGGSKVYSATEPYLGQRASHGCIRVQRKKTPEGINMQWIWDNRKEIGRIVIWEDWQGRQITIPDDDTLLYYNPKGGTYYHRGDSCASAKASVDFDTFTYGELDTEKYAKLEFCPYCAPAMRRAEIEQINAAHAFGGDHDPVMTQARMKYLSGIPYEELTPGEIRYWVETDEAAED
ncbi:MAG: L,D-transpeptidase, partial [Clostridiales bacterium]|nr:L,D-transpeptidase [Clostridiales bacterium]